MTNPERHPDSANNAPRHVAEPHPAIELIDEAQATADVRARWELGFARHGNAFAAFLKLEDIDATAPYLLERFTQFYYATFPDLRACADMFVEALGWQASLDELERTEPDLQGLLTWDYRLIEEHIRDIYEIVPYGGQIHLFDR
jgi:hypothetical protein